MLDKLLGMQMVLTRADKARKENRRALPTICRMRGSND